MHKTIGTSFGHFRQDRNENLVTSGKHFELLFYENVMRF